MNQTRPFDDIPDDPPRATAPIAPAAPAMRIPDGPPIGEFSLTNASREAFATRQIDESLAARLSRMENGLAIFDARVKLLEQIHLSAISRTSPEDWVLFHDKNSGATVGMLRKSGTPGIGEIYGISLRHFPTDGDGNFCPERFRIDDTTYGYRGWVSGRSDFTAREMIGMPIEIRSDEEFTGRSVNAQNKITRSNDDRAAALDADLKSALYTRGINVMTRILAGMGRVPIADLDRAWKGTGKDTARCAKGGGFGTSTERGAQKVADPGTAAKALELWEEILRRVGGDQTAAKSLLKQCTSFTKADGGKFDGYDSHARITSDKMLGAAWQTLKAHPTYGDNAGRREPGDDRE